jgi:hypothetical protein
VLRREVHATITKADPEGLIAGGAPFDEYTEEEAEIVRLLEQSAAVTTAAVTAIWQKFLGPEALLLQDRQLLTKLVRELAALQAMHVPRQGNALTSR